MDEPLKVKGTPSPLRTREISRLLGGKTNRVGTPLPKFMQIKKHFMKQLESGQLKPGIAMPSEMQLAEEFSVSRPTVRQALMEMEQEGLVRREQGRGTFVSENVQKPLRAATGTFVLILKGENVGLLKLMRGFNQACRSLPIHSFGEYLQYALAG